LNVETEICWGNDGFCIDVAIAHHDQPTDRVLGLICDGTRYPNTPDPIAWDVFRTAMLEGQGWSLKRFWSPQFFRDPQGQLERIEQAVAAAEEAEQSNPG